MKIKKLNESSLVDKKVNTLGKNGKPMYFTDDQLKDAKAKYPEYDFEETTIDKSIPQGQKAYIAKKKVEESKQIKTFGAKAKKLNEEEEILYVIRDSHGNQLSRPNPDDGELWDRVASMEARGRRGLRVVVYTDKNESLDEDKGQTRGKRYTTYFNRIKRAIEKGDEETLQRTKEAIMYAPAKELKNSEASELMGMIKNRKINEASYGGAYDIEDDQYFTRDDLNDFSEEVLKHVSETFDGKYDIGGVWFEDGNVITQIVDADGTEYEDITKVDMRKIRSPYHLKRIYAFPVAANIIQQIKEYNEPLQENVRGGGKYSDIFYDYLDFLEDNGDTNGLSYLVSQLIRYCKEEDLKDLWFDRMNKTSEDRGFRPLHESAIKENVMDESLAEDIENPPLSGPAEGPEYGVSSIINNAIQDEWKAIQLYNDLVVSATSYGYDDIVSVVDDIRAEEIRHVGQLQKALETISPNLVELKDGEDEAKKQLDNLEGE